MQTRSRSGSGLRDSNFKFQLKAKGVSVPIYKVNLAASAGESDLPLSRSRSRSSNRVSSTSTSPGSGFGSGRDRMFDSRDRREVEGKKAFVSVSSRSRSTKRPLYQIHGDVSQKARAELAGEGGGVGTRLGRGLLNKRRKVDWSMYNSEVQEKSSCILDSESKENIRTNVSGRNSDSTNNVDQLAFKNSDHDKCGTVEKDNIGFVKVAEDESDISDDENEESLDYVRMREANMKANEEFFASLGMDEAKKQLQASALNKPEKKYTPTQKGLRIKKEPEMIVRRQSMRIRRIDPKGTPLPEPEPVEENVAEPRLPDGPVPMKDCIFSKAENITEKDVTSFSTVICKQTLDGKSASSNITSLTKSLNKVCMNENRVAKVVPGRVFSVSWHPSPSCLLTAAGDKYGHVGLWNVGSSGRDDVESVLVFKPHIKPVSHLFFQPGHHKLFSCSYDATLRCGDFEKGVFDEVFSVPEQNDDLLRNFDFIDDGNTMLVSQYSGMVSMVDTRTPGSSAEHEYNVSRKSLRTVSVHPVDQHYFITAGVEAKINLWDLRNINAKTPKPLQTLSHHTKAISSAYFSPNGGKILSCSSDDTIVVSDVGEGIRLKLSKSIRHNNWTGRWLTNFRPTWHPFVEDVFVTGSMRRPREIEIYNTNGTLIKALQNEDYLGSVCSLNEFHPQLECAVVGANSSGRLHVFM
ncbi:WD repeat-containing protein 76 [Aplysia californica]|uniref:WD repeat-containing protein 76 n=1 Tax=Aplysia californica TaxID=6500 RepID=A0ABM0JWY3_APLCA|nr:WD repeat-containing protein 76 [Aplysia californica]